MQVTGIIKVITEVQTFGSNGFRKRELAVTTEEQYPQVILIEFVQDKCDLLNNFAEGQKVTVSINLRGREWINPQGETKYFNSIQGWKIEENTEGVKEPFETIPASDVESIDNEDDDLHF